MRICLSLLISLTLWASDNEVRKWDVPNFEVRNQDGAVLHFYDDLVKGKRVAINFIFTSCPTVCPPMGANFAALQKELKRQGQDVSLISVSIDPATDTPERLAAWRDKFGGSEGWNLVTGEKGAIEQLLKKLNVFATDIRLHAPFVVIGNDRNDHWQYLNGLTEPSKLAAQLREIDDRDSVVAKVEETSSPAARYFTDVVLVDQYGVQHRLYQDLLKGKTLIINSFFATCKGVCIKTMGCFDDIQTWLGDRLGKDVSMLSITVDPTNDTPEKLREYAQARGIKPGWLLLTGDPANVQMALGKIGQYVENPENHSNVFIVGNESTGLWKKAFGLAGTAAVEEVLQSVIEDRK